ALFAAAAVRALGGAPIRFDSLRRMGFFITTVALLAPFLSSFADAGLVASWRAEPLWRNRFVSNTLTELMLVPTAVVVVRDGLALVRRASRGRRAEAALLVGLVGLLGLVVLGAPVSIG